MTPGFTPTVMHWYNAEDGRKVATADIGPYEKIPYGGQGGSKKHAGTRKPHPQYGQWQQGFSCSRTSRTIAIDIDHAEHWEGSHAADILGDWRDSATSYRVTPDGEVRAHIMIEVPEELTGWWPTQGETAWGDIKSSGFTYVTGVHSSGTEYTATGRPWITATEDLMHALVLEPRKQRKNTGTGAAAGTWEDDNYEITSDNQLTADIMSMVAQGLDEDHIYDRLNIILKPLTTPWTPGQIESKIRSAERKVAESEQAEQDFWGNAHSGGYAGLVGELQMRTQENIEKATPKGTAADSAEWIEHQIAAGTDLRRVHLAIRLNPQQRPVEPRSKSDKGNAADILEAGLPVFRFAADGGSWLRNTGTNWETWGTKTDKAEIGRTIVSAYGTYLKTDDALAQELAAAGTAEDDAAIARDDARKKRLGENRMRYTMSAGQSSISTALVTEARATDRYSVYVGELDSEPDVLWAGGYPWSLRHETLSLATDFRDVNPVHLKTAACAPWPGETPAFNQILEAVWPDPEVRAWAVREIAGVMLWGATSKMHPVLDGPPQGGKSTFALILKTVLGSYAVQVSPDKILGSEGGSGHDEEVAAMMGARMVWMDEPPPGGKQSISRFNDLASGTGELSAARKFENRVTAPKLFNFLICQNPRNGLRMDAQGVGERMTLIPCHGIPEVTLAAWARWKMEGQAEYAAVLAMLIRECALFHCGERLEIPMGALMARGTAQERSDEFGTWVLENYDILPEQITTVDPRLANSPTIGSLRTMYNGNYARDNRLSALGTDEARDQLRRLNIRVAAAGDKSRRRKDVVFVSAKAIAYGNNY